ncbi:MAG: branched-chain amino acid aminotransferase [Thermodesulfobacteriota bacterium]
MEINITPAQPGQLKAKPDENALGFGASFSDHMFTMRYEGGQWHSPAITPYGDFMLDPAAMVLHYGQAIFEGLKAYRGKDDATYLFRPKDNLARFNRSAKRMCMPEVDIDLVFAGISQLLELDRAWVPSAPGASLYIRPTMVATEAGLGVRPAKEYLFFTILSPVGAYYPEGFNPVKIFVTEKYVRAVRGGVGEAKTAGNYAASIMAAVEAQSQGFTQVLWLDACDRQSVEEVGTMNIFFVINDEIVTPPLSGSILPGITRESVLQLCRDQGRTVRERPITIDEVFTANESGQLQEVFGTGTAAIISPVGSLFFQGRECQVNGGNTGPLAQQLFDDLQGIQYGYQPDSYNWVTTV